MMTIEEQFEHKNSVRADKSKALADSERKLVAQGLKAPNLVRLVRKARKAAITSIMGIS
ncbi:hypothetical protein [Hymenobacter sp. UYCo722]|uniref:hypothetical protein n=1 Tax=Hymenobacter sp. UYCo722 TaxID=3156335 RepID=UPI003397C6D3